MLTLARFAVAVIALCILSNGCRSSSYPQVIVIGVDGMDPNFVGRHWQSLPSFRNLRDRGQFRRLGTTTPPQSPVAWSSFITGLDPGEHGIFDFVHRDAKTLQPFDSMSRSEESQWQLPIGPYLLPLGKSDIVSLRRGTAFWERLAHRGIPVTVIRMPTNFPPLNVGRAIGGMGTPDLSGTLGRFTFFTDGPDEITRSVAGGRIVKVPANIGSFKLPIDGPSNPLRKDHAPVDTDLLVDVDREKPVARLKTARDLAVIREGEWSDWLTVEFALLPHLRSIRGMIRVYAKQFHPRFELYVSPVNIDPMSPALPVSAPRDWSAEVARDTGRFFTLGIPEDTAALRQGAFTFAEFRAQAKLVLEDEHRLLRYALRHYSGGLLFFYFSSVDQNSHMLWGQHESELLEVYREVDGCIGEVMRAFPRANLLVMSDHGFTTFDRAVHLNAWLRQRGFLSVKGTAGDKTSLADIDWSATDAYALGLNALYLNLQGRERNGRVPVGRQQEALLATLREQLVQWRDPVNGRQVVEAVYQSHPSRENAGVAPDLIVGYAPGYRASWQTGLGGAPASEIEDNRDAWIGDHCINAPDVPGVLFTTEKSGPQDPKLQDVTTLVLRAFGVK